MPDMKLGMRSSAPALTMAGEPQTLERLDPPAWGPAPPDATFLVRRCHELRHKPIADFTVDDLRLMIGQSIALEHLVPVALEQLQCDPLVSGDFYAGDLLGTVLRVDHAFWIRHRELVSVLERVIVAAERELPGLDTTQEIRDYLTGLLQESRTDRGNLT